MFINIDNDINIDIDIDVVMNNYVILIMLIISIWKRKYYL